MDINSFIQRGAKDAGEFNEITENEQVAIEFEMFIALFEQTLSAFRKKWNSEADIKVINAVSNSGKEKFSQTQFLIANEIHICMEYFNVIVRIEDTLRAYPKELQCSIRESLSNIVNNANIAPNNSLTTIIRRIDALQNYLSINFPTSD